MIRKSYKSIAFMAFKILGKFALFALQFIIAFASDKPTRKRYSALTAQHLHDEGLISDKEYAKSVFPGNG
ncbi:TPA: hypothetical protein F7136_04725 [Legionella pneumophila]|uniref:Uncharacterized protein n=1 Tax=Legionella waltersii TaxID=66969 RepID=A0A0W1A0J1_9GAMM|nr:hypothetical protein [Legionella waltersii]HAU3626744.1 hypothetical protein [Legionella pneumophila]KTD74859.1 hypothetical protein Lwal_2900 [Legionella waltersii]SNV11890.1 Uncharacterised protein [Legionella waltersii]HAU3646473.1 hypothetical protein [Legionella pneumophila]HAU3652832.1 hypothetical protein [Legionella pneumophila]